MEKTFVMIKPDGVQRGLIGEIITVLERAGLKPLAMKLMRPSRELAEKHYPDTHDWYSSVGHKTIDGYALLGKDVEAEFGTDSHRTGKTVVATQKKQTQEPNPSLQSQGTGLGLPRQNARRQ